MIEVHNLSKAYPLRHGMNQVLDNISITFPTGENIGILGRNGAGKSTLLRILANIEQPDSGDVISHQRVSWPIGFAGGFNGSLTGAENTRFVARIYGADIDEISEYTWEFSELKDYFFMPLRTYSMGMRARLAFSLSMAIDFSVYLIDEVTAVGDKPFQQKCRGAFAERRQRSSVILVSHNINTVKQYCDKCAVLVDGTLQMFDTVDAAAEVYEVTRPQ
jgi:capsular polysaccharide transport system ATP-binding protein